MTSGPISLKQLTKDVVPIGGPLGWAAICVIFWCALIPEEWLVNSR